VNTRMAGQTSGSTSRTRAPQLPCACLRNIKDHSQMHCCRVSAYQRHFPLSFLPVVELLPNSSNSRVDTSLGGPGYRCWQNSEHRNPPSAASRCPMSRGIRYETVTTSVDRVCPSLPDQDEQVKWQLKEKTEGRVRRAVTTNGDNSARVNWSEAVAKFFTSLTRCVAAHKTVAHVRDVRCHAAIALSSP
jgi:hypothetical protein